MNDENFMKILQQRIDFLNTEIVRLQEKKKRYQHMRAICIELMQGLEQLGIHDDQQT